MNLTNAKEVKINGKTVKRIKINNNIVYERIQLILSASNSFVHNTGTVLINLVCERLPNTGIDLYQVIGLTKTKIETLTTDENGQASYTYTGTGAGNVSFVAVYDNKESNTVQIDDYTPYADEIILSASASSIVYGQSVTFSATVKDQHGQSISSGTVTFKANGTSIGTGTISGGTATLTKSNFNAGSYNITAEVNSVTSNTVAVTVAKATPTITLQSDKSTVESGESFTLSGVLSLGTGVSVKLYDGSTLVEPLTTGTGGAFSETITDATGGTHTYHAVFEGNENYESVTGTVTVSVVGVALTLGITGGSFLSYNDSPFTYTGAVSIDWGDGTTEAYTGGQLNHNYVSSGSHTIKILGNVTGINSNAFLNAMNLNSVVIDSPVTSLGENCFRACQEITSVTLANSVTSIGEACFGNCESLTSITLPDNVISIGGNCFIYCSGLTEIVLEWDSSSEIVSYVSSWIGGASSFDHFLIPQGTTALYTAKGYPSNLLVEQTPFDGIDLESDKDIISYNGGTNPESATLTAQLTNGGSPVTVSGETVTFEVRKASDDSLVETLTADTDSSGIATVSYLGKGTNSLYIQAFSGSVISDKIYVEDSYFYDDYDGTKTSHYTAIRSSPSFSNSIATFPRTSSSQSYYILNEPLDFDYEVEIGVVKYSGNYIYRMAYFEGSTRKSDGQTYSANEGKFWGIYGDIYAQLQTGDVIKYKITPNKVEFYLNNVLKGANTNATAISNYIYGKNIGFNHDNNIGMQIDWIKIKRL